MKIQAYIFYDIVAIDIKVVILLKYFNFFIYLSKISNFFMILNE